jgi:hypothetical protein
LDGADLLLINYTKISRNCLQWSCPTCRTAFESSNRRRRAGM